MRFLNNTVPQVGRTCSHRGCRFRVDFVEGGEVYVRKWRAGAEIGSDGSPICVPLDVWVDEMCGAKLVHEKEKSNG